LHGQMEALVFPNTLERCENLCQEGRTVLINGRLSLQENKDAKLICNTIESLQEEQSMNHKPHVKTPKSNATPPQMVFLRLPPKEDSSHQKALKLLDIFDEGPKIPVTLVFEENDKRFKAQAGVVWNVVLQQELTRLLGEENIVLR